MQCFFEGYTGISKIVSLITQKENPNIIEIVGSIEKTKKEYKKLLRKFAQNKDLVLKLPTLKSMVSEIEGNFDIDGEPLYHGQKVAHYGKAKQCIGDHCCWTHEVEVLCNEACQSVCPSLCHSNNSIGD